MEKLKKTIQQSKKILIILGVLWVILAIVLVCPIAYSIVEATNEQGNFSLNIFIEKIIPAITGFKTIFQIFSSKYIGTFGKTLLYYTIAFFIFSTVLLFSL